MNLSVKRALSYLQSAVFLVPFCFSQVGSVFSALTNKNTPLVKFFPGNGMDEAYQVEDQRLAPICKSESNCLREQLRPREWRLSGVFSRPDFKSNRVGEIVGFFKVSKVEWGGITFGFDFVPTGSKKRFPWIEEAGNWDRGIPKSILKSEGNWVQLKIEGSADPVWINIKDDKMKGELTTQQEEDAYVD